MADVLHGQPAARPQEAAAEQAFLQAFFGKHGGPAAWVHKAHAALQVLLESAQELEWDLRELQREWARP
jgi:hypothetical protein